MDTLKKPLNRFPKILIVDDDEVTCNYILKILKKINPDWTVLLAKNGTEALEKIKTDPYQLVILDLQLPDYHGLDICREIRKWYPNEQTRILILSGFLTPQTEKAVFGAGADEYLSKIFTLTELVDKINKYF
ncbi:MAG: response regulator [Elusimicrobiota bacterium]